MSLGTLDFHLCVSVHKSQFCIVTYMQYMYVLVLVLQINWSTYLPFITGVGLLVAGPTMYTWYTSIDRVVTGGKLMAASKMVALDQLLFLPVYLASFICIMSMLRGETSEVLWTKLHRDYGHLLITSYKFWPMVQMFNFTVVPLHHRILLMNCVSIMWNTYLGWRAERKWRQCGWKHEC